MLRTDSARTALFWAAAPAAFLAIFYFFPLSRIFWASFEPGGLGDTGFKPDFTYWGRILGFTIRQSLVSTLVTIVTGLPIAWWIHHSSGSSKKWMLSLLTVPFVMPAVVVGAAFTALVGPNGLFNQFLMSLLSLEQPPLNLLHSFTLVVIAHLFYNVSVVVRIVSSFWDQLDSRLDAASSTLGAGPWARLWSIDIPLLLPGLLSAALLVFLFCFSSFGLVLILGGLEFTTLEVEIYRQAVSFFNLRAATALSLLQLVVTFLVMYLQTRLQSGSSRPRVLTMEPESKSLTQMPRPLVRFLSMFMWSAVLLLLLPLGALLLRSVTLGNSLFSLQHFVGLFRQSVDNAFLATPATAIGNSLKYGLVAAAISLVLGLCMAFTVHCAPKRLGHLLDPLFLLPLGTSTVTLGLGYILAMGPMRTSAWLVPMAHSLIALPFVLRILLPTIRGLSPALTEASAVLGASPFITWWWVELPLLVPALIVALVFAFLASLGEFGATLLVARPQHPTIPLMIFRALGRPGLTNLGQALALSTILMVLSASSMLILDRVSGVNREF